MLIKRVEKFFDVVSRLVVVLIKTIGKVLRTTLIMYARNFTHILAQ